MTRPIADCLACPRFQCCRTHALARVVADARPICPSPQSGLLVIAGVCFALAGVIAAALVVGGAL